ncbi:MAG: hypothetical protein WCD12_15070, partial [Candidatus Binatus sp.]
MVLKRKSGSLNLGTQQDKLDDIAGARVKVTAMAPALETPHVELLCYRSEFDRQSTLLATNDVAATSLVMNVQSESALEGICAQNPGAALSNPVRFERGRFRVMLR